MHAEILLIDDGGERQCVKRIHEIKVNVLIVFGAGLLEKIHNLSHLA
jgi:hypothetical protein